ncbi:hypothetical protein RJ639_028377 [Escallonia herrerae]|uniref:Helitron helicase-like domain-containing protein n=1 Tax=Escallonia herrerae TaxID=1293975 RepID=A0AA89BQU0_9ASTE|nr:hypothetical protein RJ639_028377 [Escallonia herrerae]
MTQASIESNTPSPQVATREQCKEARAHRLDILRHNRQKGCRTRRILLDSALHPSFMAMQYPVLFPYGEDGYRKNIFHRDVICFESTMRNSNIENEGHTFLNGCELLQEYIIDAYTCIEQARLNWVSQNQEKLRTDLYNNIRDVVVR